MNTHQIDKLGKNLGRVWKGVFPAHEAPLLIKEYPSAIMINTDEVNQKGEHWICMYFNTRGVGYFFDSYGRRPRDLHTCWEKFMHNNSPRGRWFWNNIQVQEDGSPYCGMHCLVYLTLKHSSNLSDKDIIGQLNDQYMKEKCKELGVVIKK